jgi:hypothetical protein
MTCPSCQTACDCNVATFPLSSGATSVETMGPSLAAGAPVVDIAAFKRDRQQQHHHRLIVFAVCVVLALALLEAA